MKTHAIQQKQRLSEPISIIAHQLKNPISVIKSYVEVLLDESIGPMTPQQKEYLRDMDVNVKKMRELVSKLIDVSRIEESLFNLHKKTFDVVSMAENIVNDLSMWAKTKGSIITLKKSREKMYVHTDPVKIKEVMENFISNAIKYNPSSRGEINISLKKIGDTIEFRCEDNGIGIEDKDAKKLFTKFYRSNAATNLDSRGTGLGLYLSKAIIEQSNGKIGFVKNKEKGAIFYFSLPQHHEYT